MGAQIAFTVRGSWPFPLDMLRHDGATAATEEDQALIDRLSKENADSREDFQPVDINLVASWKPNTRRWESFGWSVPGDHEHAFFKAVRAEKERQIEVDRLRDAAPALLAACESMIPTNVCLTHSNIRDDLIVPLDVTMGSLRKIAAAIALAKQES